MHDAASALGACGQSNKRNSITGAVYYNDSIFGGGIRVVAFGRAYESWDVDENWSFRYLTFDNTKDCSLTRHLPRIAKELEIREILVPSPADFNARMCRQTELRTEIAVGNRLRIRRGANADGCLLRANQTYGISMAGCAIVIAQYPANPVSGDHVRVAVAHAGFDSLIDRQAVLTHIPSRKPESIIENLLHALGCTGVHADRSKDVAALIVFPISPEEFRYPWDHPTMGKNNETICEYLREKFGNGCVPGNNGQGGSSAREGRIDIGELITQQLILGGVPLQGDAGQGNILLVDNGLFWKVRHKDGGSLWYTTRGDPKFKEHRNLILVTRLPQSAVRHTPAV